MNMLERQGRQWGLPYSLLYSWLYDCTKKRHFFSLWYLPILCYKWWFIPIFLFLSQDCLRFVVVHFWRKLWMVVTWWDFDDSRFIGKFRLWMFQWTKIIKPQNSPSYNHPKLPSKMNHHKTGQTRYIRSLVHLVRVIRDGLWGGIQVIWWVHEVSRSAGLHNANFVLRE